MPVAAFPEVFGGSPGPENDCGWYCELSWARRPGLWSDVVEFIAVALPGFVPGYEATNLPGTRSDLYPQ